MIFTAPKVQVHRSRTRLRIENIFVARGSLTLCTRNEIFSLNIPWKCRGIINRWTKNVPCIYGKFKLQRLPGYIRRRVQ